jgi:hypothetical protein
MDHNRSTLRAVLDDLSQIQIQRQDLSQDEASALFMSFRDCRLEFVRREPCELSDEQLHRLRQLEYRLEMVATGHGRAEGIAPEARRALEAFGWSADD